MIVANVALPAFSPHSFATALGILIIAGIEAWFLSRRLSLGFRRSYALAMAANWKSTLVGIPFAWLLWSVGLLPISIGLDALGLIDHPAARSTLLQTFWFGGLLPDEWTKIGRAAASIVSLIPFWLGSVWIERRTIRGNLPDHDAAEISKAVIQGNLATYSLFLALGIFSLVGAFKSFPEDQKRHQEREEFQKRIKPPQEKGRDPVGARPLKLEDSKV